MNNKEGEGKMVTEYFFRVSVIEESEEMARQLLDCAIKKKYKGYINVEVR